MLWERSGWDGVEIVVLDPCPATGLGAETKAALDQGLAGAGTVRYLEVAPAPPSSPSIPAQWHPDLVCIALDDASADTVACGRGSLCEGAEGAAKLAVCASVAPERVGSLLARGFDDFVLAPVRLAELLPRLRRLGVGRPRPALPPSEGWAQALARQNLVGQSQPFLEAVGRIPLVADCDVGVLISGETGTGKELFARAIHYLGVRADRPFVPVNCGAIPMDLVENELFGHQKAAYTGAQTEAGGLIEEAAGGTLFLDEIDCLPLSAQVKLLRFLQQGEYRRLGEARLRHSEARIVAAANADLEAAIAQGRLRQDLYYRLNVVPLRLPPLRERAGDVGLLANHFLARHGRRLNREGRRLASSALDRLMAYDFPGNVRELEHLIQRALVMAGDEVVIKGHHLGLPGQGAQEGETFREAKARVLTQFERSYITRLLANHRGNISRAAQAADKNRRAFFELIRKHDIDVGRFRSARRGSSG